MIPKHKLELWNSSRMAWWLWVCWAAVILGVHWGKSTWPWLQYSWNFPPSFCPHPTPNIGGWGFLLLFSCIGPLRLHVYLFCLNSYNSGVELLPEKRYSVVSIFNFCIGNVLTFLIWLEVCIYMEVISLQTLNMLLSVQFCCSHVSNSATPWTAACQTSLSITNSWSLLVFISIELVMPSDHLILCHPLLLLPSIFLHIRVFSNESVLHIR